MIVAVFYPHTIGMFIDTPPSAFYNLEISGYDVRFQKALWLMQQGERNYASIAAECGYSDRPHLIKNFNNQI